MTHNNLLAFYHDDPLDAEDPRTSTPHPPCTVPELTAFCNYYSTTKPETLQDKSDACNMVEIEAVTDKGAATAKTVSEPWQELMGKDLMMKVRQNVVCVDVLDTVATSHDC
jgi:hypothetical protein